MQESRALQYILGASLFMIALFAVSSFVMINSQAGVSTASVSINNIAPVVTSRFISNNANGGNDGLNAAANFDLIAGTTRTVHVNGIISDNNGEADIAAVKVALYKTSTAGAENCVADSNDCYVNAACAIDAAVGTGLQVGYSCAFPLEFFTDSTVTGGVSPADTWHLAVTAIDIASLATLDATYAKEMPLLTALTIPGAISYGALDLNTSTTDLNNTFITMTQQGNDVADVEVSMANAVVPCLTGGISTGSIPRGFLSWALTDTDVAGSTPLSNIVADTNLNVGYRTAGVVTKDLYWNIVVPVSGVGGTCSGNVTISTIAA